MLVEVETIRDQTRGELEGAAIQMRTLQEAMTSDHHNGSACGSRPEKNARHGDANDERERETEGA